MIPARISFLARAVPKDIKSRNITLTSTQRSNDESDEKKKAAKKKMNDLLLSLIKENTTTNEAKASEKMENSKFKKIKPIKPRSTELGEKITVAAKEVVKKMENPQKAEAELLFKMLYKNEKLQKSILKASKNETLSQLLSGMRVETDEKSTRNIAPEWSRSRSDQVRDALREKSLRPPREFSANMPRVNIFGAAPLNWFQVDNDNKNIPVMSTWEKCKSRERKMAITHPPTNYWEQMMIWTERGILWKFPIDNEQGLDEEKKVSFEDHVFLENHLEGWCPDRGPIRNFMDLVCVGLSRNHWLTAEEKKAHIMWYRDYFIDKKALILELGAGEMVDTRDSKEVTS
ncbi:28S ribosomal protein S31, mitochondrial [Cimex lectularius]|uniref:Small ribosomal subunit protein mS31 n=1 Tax=Cimex lectularius TaxID=79782 RepID=A0A8I6RSU3_CIMLE|nr:28S ribosomal protein S31, mitochondrial [Cimex lectularius]